MLIDTIYPRLNIRREYPRIDDYGDYIDGEYNLTVDWPKGQKIVEFLTDNPDDFDKLRLALDFPIEIIEVGWEYLYRAKIYHIIKLDGFYPIAKLENRLRKFWSFWHWWEVRIIRTLDVWGIAEVRPHEIIGWYCLDKSRP
jgi:hypothetical protein